MTPSRARRCCAHHGCAQDAVDRGRCSEHAAAQRKRYDTRRGSAASRGYDKDHRRWREVVLRRDPVCQDCQDALSTVADHIIPILQGGSRLDPSNGQGLCVACHNRKTARER
jgi:5-methylcytosine-specific restriction enzyme A